MARKKSEYPKAPSTGVRPLRPRARKRVTEEQDHEALREIGRIERRQSLRQMAVVEAAGPLDDIFAPAAPAAYSTTNRPPTTRPAVRPGTFGSPGFNNARAFLADRNIAVGAAARAANPGAQGMRWRDIAARAGITDFKGAKKDPRFSALQNAFYGHTNTGDVEDPERVRYKAALLANVQGAPSLGGHGSADTAPGADGGAPGDPAAAVPDFLTGDLPYTAGVINSMSADAASKRASDLESAQEELFLSGARGGAFQPAQQAAARANTQEARSGLSGDIAGIRNTATQANFAAKQQNLDRQLQERQLTLQDQWNRAQNETQRYAIEQEMARLRVQGEQALAQLDGFGCSTNTPKASEQPPPEPPPEPPPKKGKR